MIISYCVNPKCTDPKNHPKLKRCYTCGSSLILNQQYRVIKLLGRGGFGATFVGVDLTIKGNPLCVVKQLRPATTEPRGFEMALHLFEREAKTLDKINHPQIPQLIDYFAYGGYFYLIQELVKGRNLQKEVKNNGIYTELAVKRFLIEIAPVIQYIHSQKVIHRDIKPANILKREKDGKLILIDFGAVKDQVNTQLAKTFGQTALTKFAVGTMGYAPPEQLAMRPIYSSDIYALGATSLYLLTGKSPRKLAKNPDTGDLLWQQEVTISSGLAKILTKMLHTNTRERFKTINELLDAIDISPFGQTLGQNLVTQKSMSGKSLDTPSTSSKRAPVDLTQSDRTDIDNPLTDFTSATARLQAAVKQRVGKNPKSGPSNKNMQVKWTEENFSAAYCNGKKDFSNQDLSNLNLPDIKLNKFIFRYTKLEKVILSSANLSRANFYGANLQGANLQNANLSLAYLSKCNLQNADLKGANLASADLTQANLKDANLCGANLKNAKLNQKQLQSAKINWNTTFPDGSRRWWKFF